MRGEVDTFRVQAQEIVDDLINLWIALVHLKSLIFWPLWLWSHSVRLVYVLLMRMVTVPR